MNCERCGAIIDPTALACPYCHLTTPAGVLAQQNQAAADRARQQWVQAVSYQKDQATAMQINSAATQSVWLSVAGIFLCGCFPLGVVGIVQAMRANAMAAAQKIEAPPRAKIGLILGIISCAFSVCVIIAALVSSSNDQKRADARVAEIDKQLGDKASSTALDRGTACLMAEEAAIKTGFDNNAGYTLKNFDCPGRLLPSADTAQLEDLHFDYGETHYKVNVCFKHGAKWFVENLSEDPCDFGGVGADAGSAPAATAASTSTAPSQHRSKHVAQPVGGSSGSAHPSTSSSAH